MVFCQGYVGLETETLNTVCPTVVFCPNHPKTSDRTPNVNPKTLAHNPKPQANLAATPKLPKLSNPQPPARHSLIVSMEHPLKGSFKVNLNSHYKSLYIAPYRILARHHIEP